MATPKKPPAGGAGSSSVAAETFLSMMTPPELVSLEAEKLKQEIRQLEAVARREELALASDIDQERDRQVRTGLTRRLPILGPISSHSVDTWINALEHWELRDPGEPVTITIDSPGGEVLGTLRPLRHDPPAAPQGPQRGHPRPWPGRVGGEHPAPGRQRAGHGRQRPADDPRDRVRHARQVSEIADMVAF
jgi:hypothetical protein